MDPWGVDALDLDDYLARTGVSAEPPSLDALTRLQTAHVRTFTFDNIDVLLGTHPGVSLAAIQEKFVGRGRGGFYTYDWLENLIGLGIHSADRIVPYENGVELARQIPGSRFETLAGAGHLRGGRRDGVEHRRLPRRRRRHPRRAVGGTS